MRFSSVSIHGKAPASWRLRGCEVYALKSPDLRCWRARFQSREQYCRALGVPSAPEMQKCVRQWPSVLAIGPINRSIEEEEEVRQQDRKSAQAHRRCDAPKGIWHGIVARYARLVYSRYPEPNPRHSRARDFSPNPAKCALFAELSGLFAERCPCCVAQKSRSKRLLRVMNDRLATVERLPLYPRERPNHRIAATDVPGHLRPFCTAENSELFCLCVGIQAAFPQL